jgi:hypothetical protein
MIALEAGEAQSCMLRHAVQCSSEKRFHPTPRSFVLPRRLGDRHPAPAAQQRPHPLRRTVRTSSLFAHPVSGIFLTFSSRPMAPTQTLAFPPPTRSSCFVISHSHLDHINGLVLSAGSLQGPRKRVCAPQHALKTLEIIFSDRIWPNLASWDADDAAHKLLYDPYVRLLPSRTHVFTPLTLIAHMMNRLSITAK